MKGKAARTPQETPLHGKVAYRRIGGAGWSRGEGISYSGGGIQFQGEAALPAEQAAEVHMDAVKGMSPPLTAYIEVTRCDASETGGYHIAGVIKGIHSK